MSDGYRMSNLSVGIEALERANDKKVNPAKYSFASMRREIEKFERGIGTENQVGMRITGGAGGLFYLKQVKPVDPDLFVFDGLDDEQRDVRIVQHYTQVSLILVSLPKIEDEPKPIGFGMPS